VASQTYLANNQVFYKTRVVLCCGDVFIGEVSAGSDAFYPNVSRNIHVLVIPSPIFICDVHSTYLLCFPHDLLF